MKGIILLLLSFCLIALTSKISLEVERELSLKGNYADIFIEFSDKVDFSKLTKNGLKAEEMDEIPRGRFVLSELMGTALVSQSSTVQLLGENKIEFTPYYVDNVIFAKNVPKKLIEQISLIDNVAIITTNPSVDFELEQPFDLLNQTKGVEWNVEWVGADKVWEKGFKGKGIVIANSDTGVKHDLAALKKTYRGAQSSHDYNWYDGSTQQHSKVPIDTHGHGSHCMGTKVGEDGQNKIGMAPESEWIACRSLGPGASRATVLKCL